MSDQPMTREDALAEAVRRIEWCGAPNRGWDMSSGTDRPQFCHRRVARPGDRCPAHSRESITRREAK